MIRDEAKFKVVSVLAWEKQPRRFAATDAELAATDALADRILDALNITDAPQVNRTPKPLPREQLPSIPDGCRRVDFPWLLGGTLHQTHGLYLTLNDGNEKFGPADAAVLHSIANWLEVANGITDPPAQSELAEVRRIADVIIEAQSTAWPLHDILARLIAGANHLLNDHSCDTHGYEELIGARDAAKHILAALGVAKGES